ncbi:MAG: UDP-N-acetylmuramate: L-alanyl-gamma-D-glutamyl-meso-diaminopimelate ligase [Gammaproteobacteria bacterium]
MNIYILGICGTFMAGIAVLARELGFNVRGSDSGVYPPMSTQLIEAGILLHEGFDPRDLPDDTDMFIIGNTISRGNPQFEAILNRNLPYSSGPQWLFEQVLKDRWVLAVAGTHGKTTTSSMLAWIMQEAGLQPGFLIGGISPDLVVSAKLGAAPFFVIEADEYDTALFDKRSKFIHYHPRTLILNNLEFDHADIFEDLNAIKKQFHHLIRTIPAEGQIIVNADDESLATTLAMGCWSQTLKFGNQISEDGFTIDQANHLYFAKNNVDVQLKLQQSGHYNAMNATAAILAARHAGVPINTSVSALANFGGVKRRQEVIAEINGIRIIDDFAHHPTAIELTLTALKQQTDGRLFAVIDLRSNTLRMGVHATDTLINSWQAADQVLLFDNPDLKWDIHQLQRGGTTPVVIEASIEDIILDLVKQCHESDQIVIMSNAGFENIHQRLIQKLNT